MVERQDDAQADTLLAGVELGGTKCLAVLGRAGELLDRRRFETQGPADTLNRLVEQLADWHERHTVEAIGIAAFGPIAVDPAREDLGTIGVTPKPGWSGVDVVAPFRRLRLPIAVDTDVNGAALAETLWGAGQGLSDLAYVTVGTGIGAGLIVQGKPVHGRWHPEAGHLRLHRLPGDDFPGLCPFHRDCVEGLVAGPAVEARTGRRGEDLPADHPVWTLVGTQLGALAATLRLTVSPQRVLFGGGIPIGQPQLLPIIRSAAAEQLAGYLGPPDEEDAIQFAGLGRDAGPLGTIALALSAADERVAFSRDAGG